MDIGQWVRAARKFKGWSGEQLAEKLSTSKQVISHWENNRHEPTFSQILAIRDATGFELREIAPSLDWPLVRVRREQLTCLTPDQLEQLENGIIMGLGMIQSSPPSKQAARK